MPQEDQDELVRHARRWADVAWNQGWHAHALEVLDRAIKLNPTDYKLYRKRGAFYLLCPNQKVRDEEQGIADLRLACELSGWREDVARVVVELLKRNGDKGPAKEIMRELAERSKK
jgi:Flp pilus assembly protein TadD